MWAKLGSFFGAIVDGSLDFGALGEFFSSCIGKFFDNAHLVGIWSAIKAFCFSLGMALPLILLALCLVELLLGKKLLAVQRFIACAVVGYCAGVLAISPLINKIFALPEYISGIVLAIVAAVLSKYIYHAAVAITCGYSAFVLFYTDSVIKGSFPTQNNLVICIIIGLAFALLVCVLHRFAGMLITSLIGSYLITRVVISFFYDYRALAFLNGNGWIMTLIIVVVLSTVGFIVQYKTRTRY